MLNGMVGAVVCLSGGRYEPREYDLKEYWSWKGSGQPPWFIRAMRERRRHQHPRSSSTGGGNGDAATAPANAPEFHTRSRQQQDRVVSFSGASNGRESGKEDAATVSEQPILSRPTPERMHRSSR